MKLRNRILSILLVACMLVTLLPVSAGAIGTDRASVVEQTRQTVIRELARECAEKFLALGLTPSQGAELLRALEKEKEE